MPIAACDREGGVCMTVLYTQDGTDFSLVCDGCGLVVEHLGASMHTWTLAWSLFTRHGWIGACTSSGPHGCARCMVRARREAMGDEEPDRISSVDEHRSPAQPSGGRRSVALVPATLGTSFA